MSYFTPKMKILVVDDFPTMRKIVKTIFSQLGYSNFIEAEDGQKGYEALQKNRDVKFIVSDWNMPNMTGLEFLKTVRSDERFRHLPFMMITAEAEKENIIEAVKAGVSNYIVKPFTAQSLKEKISKINENFSKKAS